MSGKRRSAMSRGLWALMAALPIAIWALLTLLPTSVAAQTHTCDTACMLNALGVTPGPSVQGVGWFDPTSQIANLVSGWLPTLQGMARNLFGALFVIELFMVGFQAILFRDNLGEFFASFTFKLFTAGFFIWLMTDSSYLFAQIIGSFRQAGQMATTTSGSTLSTLYGQEVAAVMLYAAGWIAAVTADAAGAPLCQDSTACVSAVSMLAQMSALVCGAMVVLIFSSLMLLSLTYTMITIETFIVMVGGVLLVGFAGSRFTMPFSQGYLRYAVSVGMKIYVFWLIIAIASALMPGIIANAGITGGLTAIAGSIATIAASDTAAAIAGNVAETASEKGADAAAELTAIGLATTIETPLSVGSGEILGTADPGTGDVPIAVAPETAAMAEDTADAASKGPGLAARAAAIAGAIAGSRVAMAAAIAAAITGLITGTFGALQVIMLNALVSAAPGFVQSMTEGSSALSAQQTLRAMESTFTQAGLATRALTSKITSAFLENARPKEESKEKKSESPSVVDKTATISPSSQQKDTFQLNKTKPSAGTITPAIAGSTRPTSTAPVTGGTSTTPVGGIALPTVGAGTTPIGGTVLPTVGASTTSVGGIVPPTVGMGDTFASGFVRPSQRPTAPRGVGAVPVGDTALPPVGAGTVPAGSSGQMPLQPLSLQDQMAQEAIGFYKHEREHRSKQELYKKLEESGLASLSEAERNTLSPLRQAQGLTAIVSGEQLMSDDVKRWMSSNPNTRRMYRRILLQKRQSKAREDNGRGILQLALLDGALSGSTHAANDGKSGPHLGGSGINS